MNVENADTPCDVSDPQSDEKVEVHPHPVIWFVIEWTEVMSHDKVSGKILACEIVLALESRHQTNSKFTIVLDFAWILLKVWFGNKKLR